MEGVTDPVEAVEPVRDSASGADARGFIWVVDDEPGVADLVGMALRMAGHEVRVFYDPVLVLEAATGGATRGLKLLVTDQSMPAMSGQELLRGLRASGWSGPVIVASGYLGSGETREAEREAGVRFLSKPFQLDALLCMVEAALGGT